MTSKTTGRFARRGKIGTRLSVCFAAIVLLMLAADAIALWEFALVRRQSQQVTDLEEKSVSVLRLHAGVLTFHDNLGDSIRQHDAPEFANRSDSLRKSLQEQLEQFAATVAESPANSVHDPTLLSTVETVRSALPAQLDALKDLTVSGDWPAAELRLENQVKPLSQLTASLVDDVDREVMQEKEKAQAGIQRAERRVFRILPFTGLLTLLFAGVLGIVVTQSITGPLTQLDESTMALARGDFKHRIPVDGGDELATLAGIFNDASQHLDNLYQALKSSEVRFRTVVLAEPVGVAILDRESNVRLCNPAFLKILELDEEAVLGRPLSDRSLQAFCEDGTLCPSEKHPAMRVLATRVPTLNVVLRYACADGREGNWALASAWPVFQADGSIEEVILTLTDFTQQKKIERSMREMSASLARIQEDEQKRIAREIHDSTGQEITALMLTLGALSKSHDSLPAAAREKVAQCLTLAKSISSQIRTFSYLLHPPMLEEFGLWAALRIFVEEFRNRSGLEVRLRIAEDLEQRRLDPDCEMALFRLVQEALANVHRHASCTSVSVEAQAENQQVRVYVIDNGRGISFTTQATSGSAPSGAGVGIRGMKDRVHQVGGHFEIRSDHTGTTVSALIPFKTDL